MKTIEKKYKQRLEKIITDAKKDGITIFAHHEGVLIIVPTAIYDATDDLRHLLNSEYPTVDIGMHGTPVMRQRDPNMGS